MSTWLEYCDAPFSKSLPPVAVLRVKAIQRKPYHDGYCSDAGEDLGVEEKVTVKLRIPQVYVDRITKPQEVDSASDVSSGDEEDDRSSLNLNLIKQDMKHDLYCQGASRWCGYKGFFEVKSAKLVYLRKRTEVESDDE
jgi:hypothetical protein